MGVEGHFSSRVEDVIRLSRQEAIRLHHDYIGTEHLLLGIILEGEGAAMKILRNMGCDTYKVKKAVEDAVGVGDSVITEGSIPLTKQCEKVLKLTYLEAKIYRSDVIGTEHVLLSLLRDDDNIAAQILNQFNCTYDGVKQALNEMINPSGLKQQEESPIRRRTPEEQEQYWKMKISGLIFEVEELKKSEKIIFNRIEKIEAYLKAPQGRYFDLDEYEKFEKRRLAMINEVKIAESEQANLATDHSTAIYNGDVFKHPDGRIFEVISGGLNEGEKTLYPGVPQTVTIRVKK